jgi:hypothetical protein
MDEQEIRAFVEKQTSKMLESIPSEIRISEVNSVQLESSVKQVQADGVWAQWTRACCDRRRRIEDFINPVILELAVNPLLEKAIHQDHFDSNFSIRKVTEAKSLKKIETNAE